MNTNWFWKYTLIVTLTLALPFVALAQEFIWNGPGNGSGTGNWSASSGTPTDDGTFNINTGLTYTVDDVLDNTGANVLTKKGDGTLVLEKNNTYTGGTDIQKGTLKVTDTGTLGTGNVTVGVGSLLEIENTVGNKTIANNISGVGNLIKSGAGTLTLSGNANTYNGNMDVNGGGRIIVENNLGTVSGAGREYGGSITIGTNSFFEFKGMNQTLTGAINVDTGGRIEFTGSGSQTVTNRITGNGGLYKSGGGTLTLTGNHNYAGTTTIGNNSTLRIDGYLTATSTIDILAGAVMIVNGGLGNTSNNFNGGLQGTGTLTTNTTLTLNGDNDGFFGNINVSNNSTLTVNRTLAGSNYNGVINIANGSRFDFNLAAGSNQVIGGIANRITGNGVFNKSGQGWLVLTTSNDTFTGTMRVSEGTLATTGSMGGNLVVDSNGTIAPGYGASTGFGQFTVNGDVTFGGGSKFLFCINNDPTKAKQSNFIEVGGLNRNVVIANTATLDIQTPIGGKKGMIGDSFMVMKFDQMTTNSTPVATAFSLDNDKATGTWGTQFVLAEGAVSGVGYGYYVTIQATVPDFGDALIKNGFGTPNAIRAAEGVDNFVDSLIKWNQAQANTILGNSALYSALITINVGDFQGVANAFAQLHGEVYASNIDGAARMQRNFQNILPNGREVVRIDSLRKLTRCWGIVTGDWEIRRKIGQYSRYDLLSTGFAVGTDIAPLPNLLLGVAAGYDYTDQAFDTIRSKSKIDSLRTMVYASWFNGDYFLDAYGGYSKDFYEVERKININSTVPFSAVARSRYNNDIATVGIDAGRNMGVLGGIILTPSVGLHYMRIASPNITEKNAGDANLHIDSHTYQSVRVPVGVKASRVYTRVGLFNPDKLMILQPEARLFYVREFADEEVNVHTTLDVARRAGFPQTVIASSGKWGSDSGRLGIGLNGKLSEQMNFRLDYDFEVYNHTTAHAASVTFGMKW